MKLSTSVIALKKKLFEAVKRDFDGLFTRQAALASFN